MVMNCHVQQKVKVGKTVCDEASVVPWEGMSKVKKQCLTIIINEKQNLIRLDTANVIIHYVKQGCTGFQYFKYGQSQVCIFKSGKVWSQIW